jgi:hypothetical protein
LNPFDADSTEDEPNFKGTKAAAQCHLEMLKGIEKREKWLAEFCTPEDSCHKTNKSNAILDISINFRI